jgi:hypothetical protein
MSEPVNAPKEPKEPKEWTIMIYFASDNPLAPTIVSQLKAIKDAGFHPQANVVAHYDPNIKNVPSHVFEVNLVNRLKARNRPQIGFESNDPFVRNLVLDKLWPEEDVNTRECIRKSLNPTDKEGHPIGDPIVYDPPTPPKEFSSEQTPEASLRGFLNFCWHEYPARHYMLLILGHGLVVGNDIFLLDENTDVVDGGLPPSATPPAGTNPANPPSAAQARLGQVSEARALSLQVLGDILREFTGKTGRKLDLVGFHSCSMSGLEVAYEIQDSADYMLASQGPAFVGSWPYKQMLIRVFNDLNHASFRDADFADYGASLVARVKRADDPACQYIAGRFCPETKKLLGEHTDAPLPSKKLFEALVDELNCLVYDTALRRGQWVQYVECSEETTRLLGQQLQGVDQARLNRLLLQDVFKAEIKGRGRAPGRENGRENGRERMFTRIFSYCAYNSFDFQLAGYPFDIALCDLGKLEDKDPEKGVTDRLKELSAALGKGLSEGLVNGLILLAHWDAQSFWLEQYTDLFDFCRCLNARFDQHKEVAAIPVVAEIRKACENMMKVLRPSKEESGDRVIVRSTFFGPAYQYSHGLSVYFPWAPPEDGSLLNRYKGYKFAFGVTPEGKFGEKDHTGWFTFLDLYFKGTIRQTRKAEDAANPGAASTERVPMDESLLDLLQTISNSAFSGSGQLGKKGPDDPTGDVCDCPSIKNYPTFTRAPRRDGAPEYGQDDNVPQNLQEAGQFRLK